ncbi:hypothetical protein EJ03DRAFT_323920 [Teratosphaeria nubilosa]|uniref:F-box domain-containing protein n=1 Tax=Teratosphaeria nubilosa TaxID=161662 RepID=A0A6G1LLC6_9PEZI|nr:hypothetical protein EJ03DRAFT_323920 [Teratosphaeria nubilosa]
MRKLVEFLGFSEQIQDPRYGTGKMAARVFDVPELLEMILLKLGPRDVLVAMCVCRRFRDVVDRSVKLQRHIFLACDSDLSKVQFRTPLPYRKHSRLQCSAEPVIYQHRVVVADAGQIPIEGLAKGANSFIVTIRTEYSSDIKISPLGSRA